MADLRKRISELPTSTSTQGLYTLGVNAQNEGVKVPLGELLETGSKAGTEAKQIAQQAQQTANAAKTAADNAASNVGQAMTQAGNAQQVANDALTAANAAKSAAANAAGNASSAVETANAAKKAVSDAETALKDIIAPRLFINANEMLGYSDTQDVSFETVLGALAEHKDAALFKKAGLVVTFRGADGWESWQYVFYLRSGMQRPTFDPFIKSEYWRKFGGSAAVGNCFNVTNDAPKSLGFYNLEEAIAVTYDKGYRNVGMQITFAIAEKSWKTYQYIGTDGEEANFKNVGNWIDNAGMSAGDETFIIIDALCGPCTTAPYYTLEYAINALVLKINASGIDYRKPGLVISYQKAENTWEAFQFTSSSVGNFGEAGLWKPYGNGGEASSVKTKDDPEEEGKDAFSTGGAYKHIPTGIKLDTETEGVVKMQLVNSGSEAVGDEVQFAVGTGTGGGQAGQILEFTPKTSPLYGQAGGTLIVEAAITLKAGTEYESGIIEKVELYDRDTEQLLETFRLNKATSADKETFDFSFDLSSYFSIAGQRKFRFVAYDDSDRTAKRNINVTAVDVTISTEQTLHFTASTILNVGGAVKQLPMYRFANNASDKGIECTTEIFINGEWKTLGVATISDTYAHSITIDPKNCCGVALKHGAYPLRIHGEDKSSGVVGNYLHTAVMVVDPANSTPIVVTRWYSEHQDGTVKQYETISIDFAAYSTQVSQLSVEIVEQIGAQQTVKRTALVSRNVTSTYIQRVQGYDTNGSVVLGIFARVASSVSETAKFTVSGSLLNIEAVTAQQMLNIDFAGRSNEDSDKTISDNGYTLTLTGANYTTNGFVKDSFGSEDYGQATDNGEMALRIAENVKGTLNYAPFNVAAIETNGLAVQFRIRTRHAADENARLISCIANGIGFFVTANRVVFTTDNEATVSHTINAALEDDATTDVAIVIKPSSQSPYAGIGVVELYLDGEFSGACYYNTGSLSRHATNITFDGSAADLYLYNIRAWETYYSFEQAFNNYLLKMKDTDAMIVEYEFNQVMSSQSAEGRPARNIPQMSALAERNIPYAVMCKSSTTANTPENYPEYIEALDGDKKTPVVLDWYIYFPETPWRNIVIEAVQTTNQGTTSSLRPVKNKKTKIKSAARVRMMYDRSQFTDAKQLAEYDFLAGLAEKKKIQIVAGTLPTNLFTIKVDYSESGGANNGASTQLYNELSRALGSLYMTPAQNAYTGEYELNPCISSIPMALYRTDQNSPDPTSPSYGYFHAKGNYNHDKGDAEVFGFQNVDGYNKGCLNYGDFTEYIAARNQTLDDFAKSVDKSAWNTDEIIVLSEFCGPDHKVFRHQDGSWVETTGTMTYSGGRWRITGDFVNPVECYELKGYNDMDWFQNVSTIDDMLRKAEDGSLVWLQQYESRYPDNDDLNTAYEDGRKLPYRLFKWLQWCNECNQHKTAADGNITIDGVSVSGTPENRLKKFARELHTEANPYSAIMYHVFTDYLAAVDQRSKNMMVGFYPDTDGVVRMYLNHLYDGDTILGSDNDCGLTIPAELDPNNDPQGFYQGHDSVLFVQLAAASHIWLQKYQSDADTEDSTRTITVASVAAKMRSQQLSTGLRPFSPQGLEKYWITERLEKWPKLVSSYDGNRKYIENSKSTANYFYALHGLSIQRLREYIKTRFLYRDGFYQCGDTYSTAVSMRCTGTNMSVTIKAAKSGYFGLGVDRASEANGGSKYLNAGETHTFNSNNTNLGGGVMLYIFGADRIEELNIRNATPKQAGWDISKLTLLKRLIIGGDTYRPATTNGDELSTLSLGQLPFLEEVDVRNFPVRSIDASYCPRLKKIYALGSQLQSFTPAQTAPIDTLQLPDTMTNLSFVDLPNLIYPNGGLTVGGFKNVSRLQISGCPKIDAYTMLSNVLNGGAKLADMSVSGLDVSADSSLLYALKSSGVKGIGSDADFGCDGLQGRWILTNLLTDEDFTELTRYFKPSDKGLDLYNAQFSMITYENTANDTANITNDDNKTGYAHKNQYVASGHFLKLEQLSHAYKATYDTVTHKMKCEQLSDDDYNFMADGSSIDLSDGSGMGYDIMKHVPSHWYKGVDDYKNQKSYAFRSVNASEPISTANKITRKKLKDIVVEANAALVLSQNAVGNEPVRTVNSVMSVYEIDVDGMKQVRWPGVNSAEVCCVFLNADGKIVKTFQMAVAHAQFDFIVGEDYIFTDVPAHAVKFLFTAQTNAQTTFDGEAIAVDSSAIEAIEPDWVFCKEFLMGVYGIWCDGLGRPRSVSGQTSTRGNGTSTSSSAWTYDSDGNVTNGSIPSNLNYTSLDFTNACEARGKGFHAISYEQSKNLANIIMELTGERDIQAICGRGMNAGYVTGAQTINGLDIRNRNGSSVSKNINAHGNKTLLASGSGFGNLMFGIQNFVACNYEWLAHVAMNVTSFKDWKKKKYPTDESSYPLDMRWRIYDITTDTEREVQAATQQSGYCIGRVRFGRYMDIVPAKTTSDNSQFNQNYAAYWYFSNSKCRVVGRASHNAYANGGLVYAGASSASSGSGASLGSRLAFSGEIEIVEPKS